MISVIFIIFTVETTEFALDACNWRVPIAVSVCVASIMFD